MDLLKEVIAQKRKQVEDIAIEERAGAKMIRRADLFKKEKEAYLERQRQLEKEQKLNINSKNADEIIDKKLSASTSENVPRLEVIRQLRSRGHPIRLFGESDAEALKRLRKLEIEKPDLNEGWKNDFQAALSQVENEEVLEKIVKGTTGANEAEKLNVRIEENENDATWEQILNGASSLGAGNDNKDCDLIHAFIQYILKRWAKELNERDENLKKSPRGKFHAGMHKQTVEHLGPLVHSLTKHSVNSDIRAHLTNITRFCILDRNYIEANNAYMEMAIGNAPWPVGVTRSGIHQRPGSSKAYVSNVAHVMNDETQRKYVHGIKRILSKCQEFFPADPSKCVEFVKNNR